ncbi:unnamed protein product [Schistocephalus solidus]|uniref:DUF667 domain-containing protein n=1 Tax=Schistocephalus solidus TaxID=70667 RepID=A0A183T2A4_SCHSO|nr:unnamed protein product [Schistocephalus solidus]
MSSADVSIMGTASTSTCFALVARYVARLNDVSDTISAHTLDTASCLSHTMAFVTDQHSQAALRRDSTLKASSSSATTGPQSSQSPVTHFDESCEIPLFGPICFRLAAQPYSLEKPLHRGLLWIRALNVAPEQEAARLYDCQLKGQCLFARLIRPTERSTTVKTPDISHVTDHRKQASESGRFAAVKSPAKVRLRVPSRWDLILKIDSDTELLDEAPKPRLVLLSTYSLTPSEVNLLAETSLPLKTYPAEETKVREGKDVGSKSQGHQRVSSDGLVLQAPTASGGDGPETVPVEEQSNQDSVSSASIDSVSEMPPVISQGSPESGACDTACAIESEHDSTNHQSGSERGYTANSDLTQVKGEKHDANSSPNPVSSACADTVSPIGHEFVAKMESSDREVTVGSNCVADLLSHEVTSNGVPKITGESKTHHEVSSVHRRCSIPAEGHHLRESIHTEARMRSISLPSQQMGEDELNEVSSLPMASDEVALMRTRKASLMLAESDKSNQISSPGCHSATPLSPSNEVIVAPVSPPLFLSRQRHSLDSPNKYARKKMVKTLTRSLDRSIPLSLSLGGSSSVSLTPGKPDSGGNCRTYYRRLSLPESVSVCVSSQFSTSLISRPDRDSTEGGSKHDGVAVTQTTTDDAYQTGSENVSLLSDPAFVAATADDEREESSALTTSRANGSGGDGMEEQEKADSRSVSGRQRTSEMPSPLRRRLATFHVATNPVSGPDVSFSQSRMSEDDSLLKVVYEISAFEVFSRQSAEGPAQEEEGDITPTAMKSGLKEEEDDKLNCGGSTNAWFSAIQAHLKEQGKAFSLFYLQLKPLGINNHLELAEWGARVFNKVMTIAEATSFTKKGSIIRASAFLDNLNIPEFSLEAVAAKRSGDLPTTVL